MLRGQEPGRIFTTQNSTGQLRYEQSMDLETKYSETPLNWTPSGTDIVCDLEGIPV